MNFGIKAIKLDENLRQQIPQKIMYHRSCIGMLTTTTKSKLLIQKIGIFKYKQQPFY